MEVVVLPVGSEEPQSRVEWMVAVFRVRGWCIIEVRVLLPCEVPKYELFGYVGSILLDEKIQCAIPFSVVFQQFL